LEAFDKERKATGPMQGAVASRALPLPLDYKKQRPKAFTTRTTIATAPRKVPIQLSSHLICITTHQFFNLHIAVSHLFFTVPHWIR
jgi:hypothetical protein